MNGKQLTLEDAMARLAEKDRNLKEVEQRLQQVTSELQTHQETVQSEKFQSQQVFLLLFFSFC